MFDGYATNMKCYQHAYLGLSTFNFYYIATKEKKKVKKKTK